jgi:hypothetical protein
MRWMVSIAPRKNQRLDWELKDWETYRRPASTRRDFAHPQKIKISECVQRLPPFERVVDLG